MVIFHLVYKSLRQHLVSTGVSALAIALAGGLLMSVWVLRTEANRTFSSVTGGFDAVLGVRSSKLQLVLNAIFHLEDSPGNMAMADFDAIKAHPVVELAIPIAVGDNYKGYRLVGVTLELFDRVEYRSGQRYQVRPDGRLFRLEEKEAVAGSFAAKSLGLKIGDTFHPYHGLYFDETHQHAETYTITGILEPTGTPADKVIWIHIQGLQKMSGHDPRASSDISAVLVKLRASNPMAGFQLDQLYNKRGNKLTFAWPIGSILAKLFDKIAWFDRVLALVSYMVVIVASFSILASIYNSMNERRREIAILRALGAKRATVCGSVILESAAIAAIGMLLAYGVYAAIMGLAASIIRTQTGVIIDVFSYHQVLWLAPLGIIGLGALCGVLPAIKAYRTDVVSNLIPQS